MVKLKQRLRSWSLFLFFLIVCAAAVINYEAGAATLPKVEKRKPAQAQSPQAFTADFDKDVEEFWDKSWTTKFGNHDTWKNGKYTAVWNLNVRRHQLRSQNLFMPYKPGEFPVLPAGQECVDNDIKFRSADGRCNDLNYPAAGMPGIRFGRNTNPNKVPATDEEILDPNPRQITKELMVRENFKAVPFLNVMAAAWIQFMVHDWFDHGDNDHSRFLKVPLTSDDPFAISLKAAGQDPSFLLVPRTQKDDGRYNAVGTVHQNKVTAWWDMSQVYGSDLSTQHSLRTMNNGLMKVTADGKIPVDTKSGKEITGFNKNWWTGLSVMHRLFVLEHNKIAAYLNARYPEMSDDQLFHTARLINTAVQAKIHTIEWTPAVLSNVALGISMEGSWKGFRRERGMLQNLFEKSVKNLFNPKFTKNAYHAVPWALSEEFVSAYRMHPLLPDQLSFRSFQSGETENVPLPDTRENKAHQWTDKYSMAEVLYSLGANKPGQLVLKNYPKFLTNLDITDPTGKKHITDIAMLDVLRDRERGIPRYNEFRRQVHLAPVPDFSYLTPDVELVAKLRSIYNNDINKVDVLVGSLAEMHRPEGFGFSETLFQIFLLMASRRVEIDRFFTIDFRPEVYTPAGIEWVNRRNMKAILLDHAPQLINSLAPIKNPFRPWVPVGRRVAAADSPDTFVSKKRSSHRFPSSVGGQCQLTLNQEYTEADDPVHYLDLAHRMQRVMYSLAAKAKNPADSDTLTYGRGGDVNDGSRPRRAFHAKHHGCLKANFQVLENLDAGIFKLQNGKLPNYQAWVRFSNAKGELQPDGKADLRGFAIKLSGVTGQLLEPLPGQRESTQDFLLTNAPVHFAANAEEMVRFAEATASGKMNQLKYAATNFSKAIQASKDSRQEVESVADISYYSRLAFLFGTKAAKFSVTPCTDVKPVGGSNVSKSNPHFLREDLINRGKEGSICFDFNVQYQVNACSQPVENATVEWKASEAPFKRVARITFDPQEFAGPQGEASEQDVMCEEMKFNPWHGLNEHRPLGDMNRARRSVYYETQKARSGH
ncbi:MAG: peroxidase family protein [Bdellovibrionota bacterium]